MAYSQNGQYLLRGYDTDHFSRVGPSNDAELNDYHSLLFQMAARGPTHKQLAENPETVSHQPVTSRSGEPRKDDVAPRPSTWKAPPVIQGRSIVGGAPRAAQSPAARMLD